MITIEPMKVMMEPMKIARQWVDFQKIAFDNTFDTMMMFQDLTEKMTISFLDYVPWLPEEGKKAINEWISTYNKGCKDFKKAVDDNFDNVSMFFPEPKKVGKGKSE